MTVLKAAGGVVVALGAAVLAATAAWRWYIEEDPFLKGVDRDLARIGVVPAELAGAYAIQPGMEP